MLPISQTSRLDVAQISVFRRDGFLKFEQPVFSSDRFESLKQHFEELLAGHTAQGRRPEAMDKPHFVDTQLFDWVLSDSILDLVEPLLGPDFHLFSTHFISKSAGDGKRVPWHEDSAYWKGLLTPMEAVTVWLAIDPSTLENGCMWLVPRSHENGFSDYEGVEGAVFATEIIKPQQRAEQAIPIELQPNQASLHDAKMIHGSPPNTSKIRRCGFTMRFVPAHVRLQPEWEDRIRLYPARGRDLAGNNLADPSKVYPELYEAQFSGRKVH